MESHGDCSNDPSRNEAADALSTAKRWTPPSAEHLADDSSSRISKAETKQASDRRVQIDVSKKIYGTYDAPKIVARASRLLVLRRSKEGTSSTA